MEVQTERNQANEQAITRTYQIDGIQITATEYNNGRVIFVPTQLADDVHDDTRND